MNFGFFLKIFLDNGFSGEKRVSEKGKVWSRNWLAKNSTTTLISVNSTGTIGGDSSSGGYSNLSISDNG
jgi:hypothetical protein